MEGSRQKKDEKPAAGYDKKEHKVQQASKPKAATVTATKKPTKKKSKKPKYSGVLIDGIPEEDVIDMSDDNSPYMKAAKKLDARNARKRKNPYVRYESKEVQPTPEHYDP